jgi:hypothetical protein
MKVIVLFLVLFVGAFAAEMPELVDHEPVLNFNFDDSNNILSFDAYGHSWSFLLERQNLTGPNSYYHGSQIGGARTCSFTIGKTEFMGMILGASDSYYIERLHLIQMLNSTDLSHLHPDDLIIYRAADIRSPANIGECKLGHQDVPEEVRRNVPEQDEKERYSARFQYLALYVDYLFVQRSPYDPVGILNHVNAVYARSGLHGFYIHYYGYIGFNAGGDIGTALNQLVNFVYYYRGFFGPNFDNIFLLTGQFYGWNGGGTIGLAYIGSGCWPRNYYPWYKTGVGALCTYNLPYMIQEVAHELGHNRTPGNPSHDFGGGCFVMNSYICDSVGGVIFRPSWVARMC